MTIRIGLMEVSCVYVLSVDHMNTEYCCAVVGDDFNQFVACGSQSDTGVESDVGQQDLNHGYQLFESEWPTANSVATAHLQQGGVNLVRVTSEI